MGFFQSLRQPVVAPDPRRQLEQAWEAFNQGGKCMAQGKLDQASDRFDDALSTFREQRHKKGLAAVSLNSGVLAQKRGDLGRYPGGGGLWRRRQR